MFQLASTIPDKETKGSTKGQKEGQMEKRKDKRTEAKRKDKSKTSISIENQTRVPLKLEKPENH